MPDNPFETPQAPETPTTKPEKNLSSGRATYNVVTDTVTGVNVRWSDNKFQAIFIFLSVLICAAIGSVVALIFGSWRLPWYGGAAFGVFAGLIIGVIASGTVLMIYRAKRHIKGKHD
ncbi:MAG: hypothetical protein R3C03_03115 [Pirellulaceae bacterium]